MLLDWIQLAGKAPLYRQLYDALRSGILQGRLGPGLQLPSTRGLAEGLGVSRNVVLLAFSQLEAEGYIEGRQGSGTYVAHNLPDALLRRGAAGRARPGRRAPRPRLTKQARRALSLVVPATSRGLRYDFRYGDVPRDETTAAAWRKRLLQRSERAPMGYGDPRGAPELRRSLARQLGEHRGIDCEPDQLFVTCGSQQGLDLVGRALLEPGRQVAVEDPGYGGARMAFQALGADVRAVPVDDQGLRVEQLGRRAPEARLAYVTPSHQFPTGAILPLARRLALIEWARRQDAFLIEDDYDSEYRYDGPPIEPLVCLDGGERTLYLGTFSKVFLPAIRLGYLVLPPSLVEPLSALRWLSVRHGPTLEQLALADMIDSGDFDRHLRRMRRQNSARRQALLEALDRHLGERVQVVGTEGGVHIVLWLRDVKAPQLQGLIAEAARQEVGIYAIDRYYARPPRRAGLLLGYSTLTERQIGEGIRRLARVMDRPLRR